MSESSSEPCVDLSFRATGGPIPLDHGYALFGALGRVLGDVHGADWLAVHPIVGIPRGDGTLGLHPRRGALRLRTRLSSVPRLLALAGKTIELAGTPLLLGVSTIHALEAHSALYARVVTIKGFLEQLPFVEAVERQLGALDVRAEIDVGRRRIVTIAGDKVVGFELCLRELAPEASIRIQSVGIGGRRRMGCGVFSQVQEQSE
jgi:CRISPR-associated endonuclease/helicase Cas3